MERISVFQSSYCSLPTVHHPKYLFAQSSFFSLLTHLVCSLQNTALCSEELSLIAALESLSSPECLRRAMGERDDISKKRNCVLYKDYWTWKGCGIEFKAARENERFLSAKE